MSLKGNAFFIFESFSAQCACFSLSKETFCIFFALRLAEQLLARVSHIVNNELYLLWSRKIAKGVTVISLNFSLFGEDSAH